MSRRRTVLVLLAIAGVLAGGIAAPAASADEYVTGSATSKRFGKVTVTFTYDPGTMRLTLSDKLAKATAGREFSVECRTNGRYTLIAAIQLLGNGNRRLAAPAVVPEKADRCRVRRDRTIVGTMVMRRRG